MVKKLRIVFTFYVAVILETNVNSKGEKLNLSGALLFGLIIITIYYLLPGIISTCAMTCKQSDTRPNVYMYIQIVQRSEEIERQNAEDHNSLDTFKKKWSRLKTSPL